MAHYLNQVRIRGYVGADPVLNQGPRATAVTLTVYTAYTSHNNREYTSRHRVKLFNGLATFAANEVRKGSRVDISGRIEYSEYEVEGQRRFSTDIIARDLVVLQRPANTPEPQAVQQEQEKAMADADPNQGDSPF